jgi:hypothetical protein
LAVVVTEIEGGTGEGVPPAVTNSRPTILEQLGRKLNNAEVLYVAVTFVDVICPATSVN